MDHVQASSAIRALGLVMSDEIDAMRLARQQGGVPAPISPMFSLVTDISTPPECGNASTGGKIVLFNLMTRS